MSADSQRTAWREASGIPFRELIDKLIELALEAESKFVAQVKLHHARLAQKTGIGTERALRLRQ